MFGRVRRVIAVGAACVISPTYPRQEAIETPNTHESLAPIVGDFQTFLATNPSADVG